MLKMTTKMLTEAKKKPTCPITFQSKAQRLRTGCTDRLFPVTLTLTRLPRYMTLI